MPNIERYKIIMDIHMILSTENQHLEDLENLFKALIKFVLKIFPTHVKYSEII